MKKAVLKWLGIDPAQFKENQDSLKKYIDSMGELSRSLLQKQNAPIELQEEYLYDFLGLSSQSGFGDGPDILPVVTTTPLNPSAESVQGLPKVVKVPVKPIDVLCELETVPTPFSLHLLDEKITILKDKEKIIIQKYAKREVSGLIQCLENRKKYNEHIDFFETFKNTTDEKIDVLLKKHGLVQKTSDIFVPEFPKEAIEVMKQYTEKVKLICGKNPIFYVIATADLFKKKNEKRDPILLVQSPFGFFWQILGAWDKEMLILSEL